jgi:oligopeptide transport system permease protein
MTRYVLKRLALAAVTLFIILSLTFILMKLLPFSKPVANSQAVLVNFYNKQVHLGYVLITHEPNAALGSILFDYTEGTVHYYFYQRPIMEQYGSWLKDVFTEWNWGTSTVISPNVDVIQIINAGLPITVKVNVISVVVAVPLGIALGIWAALKKNTLTDHIISTLVMIFISVPSFIVITLLVMWFGYDLKLLPTSWPSSSYPTAVKAAGFVIPVIALSFGSICGYCRFTRAELCEVLSSDYLLLARTKGLTKRQAVMRHALRNAMVPILPSILAEIVGVLSGSMILETLYAIPGIGKLFYDAISEKDFNVLMVDMALFTTIGLVAGIVLDLSYGFLDPRIRMGEKK